jgi:hypothetical protein
MVRAQNIKGIFILYMNLKYWGLHFSRTKHLHWRFQTFHRYLQNIMHDVLFCVRKDHKHGTMFEVCRSFQVFHNHFVLSLKSIFMNNNLQPKHSRKHKYILLLVVYIAKSLIHQKWSNFVYQNILICWLCCKCFHYISAYK